MLEPGYLVSARRCLWSGLGLCQSQEHVKLLEMKWTLTFTEMISDTQDVDQNRQLQSRDQNETESQTVKKEEICCQHWGQPCSRHWIFNFSILWRHWSLAVLLWVWSRYQLLLCPGDQRTLEQWWPGYTPGPVSPDQQRQSLCLLQHCLHVTTMSQLHSSQVTRLLSSILGPGHSQSSCGVLNTVFQYSKYL